MKIILIGFMGAGKSTVAKQISHMLEWPMSDMDDLICRKTGFPTIQDLFNQGGELLLREMEIVIAKESQEMNDIVISTGGGVVLNKIIIDYFKQSHSQIFFLNTPFDLIVKRISKHSRPLFSDITTLKELYEFRLPLYRAYADHIIDVGTLTPKEITSNIINQL